MRHRGHIGLIGVLCEHKTLCRYNQNHKPDIKTPTEKDFIIKSCPAFTAHIFWYESEREPYQQGNYYKVVKMADYGNEIRDEVYGIGKICERTNHQYL